MEEKTLFEATLLAIKREGFNLVHERDLTIPELEKVEAYRIEGEEGDILPMMLIIEHGDYIQYAIYHPIDKDYEELTLSVLHESFMRIKDVMFQYTPVSFQDMFGCLIFSRLFPKDKIDLDFLMKVFYAMLETYQIFQGNYAQEMVKHDLIAL